MTSLAQCLARGKCFITAGDDVERCRLGQGGYDVALPLPASRWRQEPEKKAFGLCPVDCEPQVSSDS